MFPYKANDFGGNINLAIFINLIIYSIILLISPIILVFLVSLVRPKIKKQNNILLYSFSSAMLLILGTVGFIKEGYSEIEIALHSSQSYLTNGSITKEQFLIAAIIGSGALVGLMSVFILRAFFSRFFKEVHVDHTEHSHSDHIINFSDIDNPKAAWLAILLLLSHRTIDGFVLGATVSRITQGDKINIGLIVTFNLHILIEILIVYYRQVQYGQNTKKAMLYNFISVLILIPIMTIGAFINRFLSQIWWLLPFIYASGGTIIAFVAVIELVPEFIHLRNDSKKTWYFTLISFGCGIIFTLVILSFHSHSSNVEIGSGGGGILESHLFKLL
ncbi:predicted coding region [Mycoplasmopsis pulmonis]|uniref:ZIP Zinc transporter n=1 Tax=Mycoplasmopsis pulmonis (strain UAB CTIP) TaxID=272635 RepID=Q98QR9_MYCPU|nr:hypothetical protein [Mycoplasmopsis pulmonis]MDZ7293251.1 hypothetical protein [Mycoplasmopsis pulmonis]CAC13465.1 predicted coding region [Mycoplasmopsis pulmonis]VEU68053.1 Uncharacterised protein [Mycoplasmopsis pulmonis]